MNPKLKELVGGLVGKMAKAAQRAGRGSVVSQARFQRRAERASGLPVTKYQDILRDISMRDPDSETQVPFPPSPPKPPRRKGMSDSYSPEGQELSEAKRKRITKLHGKYPKGTHYCATHVEHAEWGRGRTITTQHAKPDQYGDIDWYDVMFEHGVEKSVPTDDLRILLGEGHPNHEHHEYDGEEMVMEYLASFFGEELTESTDEITDEQLIEAIESINALTAIVNEYFGLNEDWGGRNPEGGQYRRSFERYLWIHQDEDGVHHVSQFSRDKNGKKGTRVPARVFRGHGVVVDRPLDMKKFGHLVKPKEGDS